MTYHYPDPMIQPADWPLAVIIFMLVACAAVRVWLGWKERHR